MPRRAPGSGPASIVAALLAAAALVAAFAPSGCARETPCDFNSDCVVGYCQDGVCKKNCVDASRDCPTGYLCNANAQCVPPGTGTGGFGGGGTGGATSSSSVGGAGGVGGMAVSSSTGVGAGPVSSSSSSSTTSSTSGGPATKHELDLCASDGECASPLICRPWLPGGQKRCTRTCGSTGQCMTGTVCAPVGSEQYCVKDDTGRDCGSASACNFGCINNQYCTVTCVSGADCPNGYGCMGINNIRVCIKAEAPCSSQDPSLCVAPAACDESPNMVVGGCTLVCDSAADCPQRATPFSPWTCDAGGICRRPPDVSGPLETGATPAQYACNGQGTVVNVCNDNQHIDFNAFNIPNPPAVSCNATTTTSGIPTDSCVDSCRYQGGCPFGSACVAVGGVGNARIGLCLPTGANEIGTPCVHDAQCTFGYCLNGKCSRDCTADGLCTNGTTCTPGGGPPVDGQPFRRCQ